MAQCRTLGAGVTDEVAHKRSVDRVGTPRSAGETVQCGLPTDRLHARPGVDFRGEWCRPQVGAFEFSRPLRGIT